MEGSVLFVGTTAAWLAAHRAFKHKRIHQTDQVTGMDLVFLRNSRQNTTESIQRGLRMLVRPTDIFVVTYPKCGTTWMQQIVHGLRTNGSMDFEEISEVMPWTIVAHDCGQDINSEQVASPRAFKSHECYEEVPKGGKYIYVSREPREVLVSFYHFLLSWTQVDTSTVTIEEFCDRLFVGVGSNHGKIWDHFYGWWEHRDDPNVLWVCYEDMIQDLRSCVERVAIFMGVDADESCIDTVVRQSSFSFMQQHAQKFDEHFVFAHVREQMGIDTDFVEHWVGKVRAGVAGKKRLSVELERRLDEQWTRSFAALTGIASYSDLRAQVSVLAPRSVGNSAE